MKLWLKKLSVVLITFMTVGMYIPPTYLDAEAESANKEVVSSNDRLPETDTPLPDIGEIEETQLDSLDDEDDDVSDHYIHMVTNQAKEQTVTKLGPKIVNKVENDVMTTILPHIEEVIVGLFEEAGQEKFQFYEITEDLTPGYGEKIFNVYDHQAKQDVAMFHVRREIRPKEGYWFNFHYHLSNDDFEEHYNIGDIYWDKNTPPKWMSQ
ncbi:YpjP family protein [Salipaludibacillus sp. CF4.18]|uniref:YpjP family protein n=1 Tax=Salipaludibacillus sp. CF4.18 TaxID=3373081 RepID=UPI003EE44C72